MWEPEKEKMHRYVGKTIKSIEVTIGSTYLTLCFNDGTGLGIYDAPNCCESRYMVIDDDLTEYEGATFLGVLEKPSSEMLDVSGDVHEVMFVEVVTSKGPLTIVNHNEHNGYYGGFYISFEEKQT
jgi:hypothetical protein